MGCGMSLADESMTSSNPKPSAMRNNGVLLSGIRPSSHPRETRIIQAELVDSCVEAPSSQEAARPSLDEGEFFDGMLGLADEGRIQELVAEMAEGDLYKDPDFPADRHSLSFSQLEEPHFDQVQWKRPMELVAEPYLFIDGASRSDVEQGSLGDCWLLSSCAAVARRPELLSRVIPGNQPLFGPNYRGALVVHFWRFGRWVTVHIDDRLPVQAGKLIFARCTNPDEFWVAFVEKAYAKLHGSYEALGGGHALEALVDLTGSIAEKMDLTPETPFELISEAIERGALITCGKKMGSDGWHSGTSPVVEDVSPEGLTLGHAYTVTEARQLDAGHLGLVQLIRIRNPWANDVEWTGRWSDGDTRWTYIPEDIRQELEVKENNDGEFWMEMEDFSTQFQQMTIATLEVDLDHDGQSDEAYMVLRHGAWVEGVNAGGSRNDLESFAMNPQYQLTLSGPDKPKDGETVYVPKCSILISLMQDHRRSEKRKELRMLGIAFFIYKAESAGIRLEAEYFLMVPEVASSGVFTNSREVMSRFELEPGVYVVIPSTFYPSRSRHFMLRAFALEPFQLEPLPDYTPMLVNL